MFNEFSEEQILKCDKSKIRLRELHDVFKRWYYRKDNYIGYLSRNDIEI